MTMAYSSMQTRPFAKLSTTPSPNSNNSNATSPIKSPLGNGTGPWGSRTASIWGNGHVPNALAPKPSIPDRSNTSKSTTIDMTNDATTKKGSGSLLASSESDTWTSHQPRNELRPTLVTRNSRGADGIDYTQLNNPTTTISPTTTRPPIINLTNSSFPHSRSAFSPPHLNTSFGGEAPTVYPKNKDRPYPGSYTPADSVVDYMSTSTSPISERRPQWPSQYSSSTSVATSRDASRGPQAFPTDRHYPLTSSDVPTIAPRYNAFTHGGLTPSSRNGSLSSSTDFVAALDGLSLREVSRPSSSRGLPLGTRIGQDNYGANANQDLLANLDQLLPSPFQPASQYGTTSYGPTAIQHQQQQQQQQMMSFNYATHNRPSNDAMCHFGALAAQQIGHSSRQQTPWQDTDATLAALSRRLNVPQDQQFYLDPRFAAQMLALKQQPYNLTNGYGNAPAATLNGAQSMPPYYTTGLGSIPASLPAPEVEQGLQSAKLFDFKMAGKNTRRYELRDIYEHIAEFAGDQHGSRFIQTKLETANSDEKERVFREIEPNAIPLMTDVFGNYVIQKFFDHGHQEHKRILANKMRGQVLALSTQMYGCRVVQKALEHVLLEQQAALVNELKNHVLKCVKDQNGNHVIQKVIERCSTDSIAFVYEAFIGQAHSLSLHPYGCRVIQRCLERTEWYPAKAAILAELHEGVPKGMVGDSYGNYVVQHIVQNGPEEDRKFVLGIVLADVESFSKHKFASNVVEKCIEYSDDHWRRQVVDIFTKTDHRRPDNETVLVGLIKDQYGNYVIQRLLDRLPMQDYVYFHHQLQPAMTHAKRTGSGKQVVSIEKKMQRFDFVPSLHDPCHPSVTQSTFAGHFTPTNNGPTTRSCNNFSSTMLPPMINSDTVGGATSMSRENSEAFNNEHSTARL